MRDITDIIRFAQSPWDGALFRRIYYKFCAGIPKAVAERAAAHNPTAEPLLLAVADDDVSPYTRRQCRMLQTHLQNLRTEKANRAVYRIVAFMGYGDYLDQCGADKSRAEILEALGAQEPDPAGASGRAAGPAAAAEVRGARPDPLHRALEQGPGV